jgi:hypothetical protein
MSNAACWPRASGSATVTAVASTATRKGGRKTPDFKKTSHGSKKIDDHLLGQMARQCKLTGKVFALLVDCPLDRGDDENRLADQSLNDPPDGMR